MNNHRHFGISPRLDEQAALHRRKVADMPRTEMKPIHCHPRFPWFSWSWQMAGIVSAIGMLVALWVEIFQ